MEKYKSKQAIYRLDQSTQLKPWLIGFLVLLLAIIFLPWTQNIRAKGNVTGLFQEQKPQKIYSPIAGKIAIWWVKEGDVVSQGDTLVKISEIKADYLDPQLIARTQTQLDAKKNSLDFYTQKVTATEAQINNLRQAKTLKKSQLSNKIVQLQQKLPAKRRN